MLHSGAWLHSYSARERESVESDSRMKCWMLTAALFLATLGNAQAPEILSACQRGATIPCNVASEWDLVPSPPQETTPSAPGASSNAAPNPWAFALTTSGYIVPGGPSYVSPDFTADRGWLHLEARYNYEALETGSLWVGYNFSAGKKLVLNVTPMFGGVFGDLNGVAPGYLFTLTYKKVQLYSSGEFVSMPRIEAATTSTIGANLHIRLGNGCRWASYRSGLASNIPASTCSAERWSVSPTRN